MSEINPQRLMNDLRHLRTIGKYGTGVVRPALSTKDMEARQWLLDRMGEAGLKTSMDGVGNVFARSRNPGKGVLIGSHTNTQRTKFLLYQALLSSRACKPAPRCLNCGFISLDTPSEFLYLSKG